MMKRLFGAFLVLALVVSFVALFAFDAHAVSNMKASNACIELIKDMEGFYAIPYWDYSQWTVGFGTTCPSDRLEEYKEFGIPVDEANALLYEQMATFEKAVNKFIDKHGLSLSQNQFDALVSFTYNLGSGMLSNESNTIVQAILSGADDNELIYAFSVYCMAGGELLPGLMRRRMAEANMFLYGVYDEYPPESYCYVRYNPNGGVRDSSAQAYDANMPAVPMSRPTKAGYVFVGWYTSAVGGVKVTSLDETTAGMTLYAHWQKAETEAENPADPTEGINVVVVSASVNVRCGPGIGYGIVASAHAGDKLTIIGTTLCNGEIWGQFADGWINLVHTDYFENVAPDTGKDEFENWQLPVLATVIDAGGVLVYNGPHTTYPQLRKLSQNTQIQILETMVFAGKLWGRYEDGWVQLDTKLLIHDENTLVHSFTAAVKTNLAVRSGPGYDYEKLTSLALGSTHRVYAIVMVDNEPWGRVAKGWVNLNYTDYDASKLSQYQDHIYSDWYTSKEATCVAPGQESRDCLYCSHKETRDTVLGDHGYGSWYVVKEATCVAEGLQQRDCQYCGGSETCAIAVTDHNLGDWYVAKEPTAEEPGQERRDCQHCDYYETRETATVEHSFGDWYVSQAATCTEPGQERRDCQHCDYYETREIATVEHSFGDWYVSQAATCMEPGQERRDCQHCDYHETRGTAMLEHSIGDWYVSQAATCTEPGQERRDCQYCDHHETRELDALGHSYGQWYESVAPTVDACGQERRDCQRCDSFEVRETDKLPEPEIIRTYAKVTCSQLRVRSGPGTGYAAVSMLKKGDVVEILEIKTVDTNDWGRIEKGWICLTGLTELFYEKDTHEHSYGQWYVYREATCTEDGILRRDCTGCDHYETDKIAAVGHSYGAWYVSKEATTTEFGEERRDCSACGYYETRQIDKLPAPTITKTYATVTCSALRVRSGPGTEYAMVTWLYKGKVVEVFELKDVGTNQWARIENGWICITGNATLSYEEAEHVHSFGDWYVTKEATITEYGEERRDCSVCGHCEIRQTDKLPSVTKVYATITCDALSIRKGAGTGYARVGYYYRGAVVEILEQVQVGENTWGRTDRGWICLTGYTTLETVTEPAK